MVKCLASTAVPLILLVSFGFEQLFRHRSTPTCRRGRATFKIQFSTGRIWLSVMTKRFFAETTSFSTPPRPPDRPTSQIRDTGALPIRNVRSVEASLHDGNDKFALGIFLEGDVGLEIVDSVLGDDSQWLRAR